MFALMRCPPNPTSSFFLPNDDVQAMEEFVQRCQEEKCQARASRVEPEEDHYEKGMSVPVSVLDGCGESFMAADEKWEKASTRFFTDTGLMALLCRHDRVLWIANLTSAGEKQHYVLALLDLAVFHAYGHQWPCQIIYHPRKCKGFGLSDGEGCERLWSSLKQLIPSLRVSGFNQHLFMLDTQIRHLDTRSLQGFGHWLHQCWIHCQIKKNAALVNLQDLDLDEDMLRAEWKAQIAHQTRPTPRQSRNKAAEVITTILALEKMLDVHDTSVHELEVQLHGGRVNDMVELNLQLVDASALGIGDKAELEKMKKDVYLTVRLNARAVKTCIRDHLSEKLHANMQHSIKRHEPGILKLVSTYNGLLPSSAIPPHCVPHDGIFQLDVDNDIWQDIGLDDTTVNPPAWLSDEGVRNGIRLQLEVDRCLEEEARLMLERSVMQEWMLAEWEGIQDALTNAGP
ncbi:hypothetical protein M405DRAFT_916184 [Rhizopogon salebrosus TDB-379]|nr:hypothetical protein M405DRAFT_916184 [Rhizopogon salebrosus TDB-379]